MKKKLFCEISPLTYKISQLKCCLIRAIKDFTSGVSFAVYTSNKTLPVSIYKHKSLIRRKLGNVDLSLQENKAVNLAIASKHVTNIIIKPGEVFSFWKLVGSISSKKGYKDGLTISNGEVLSGIGGGMCQFTNLIHWIILHTPMEIIEHHHHDGLDLFPDFNRQIPFGTGTSIMYNYLDYRFKNTTDITFQLITYLTDEYLCGELKADKKLDCSYHIKSENEHFTSENGTVYRMGEIYRERIDIKSGNVISKELIRSNHAKVMYDTSNLQIDKQIFTAK